MLPLDFLCSLDSPQFSPAKFHVPGFWIIWLKFKPPDSSLTIFVSVSTREQGCLIFLDESWIIQKDFITEIWTFTQMTSLDPYINEKLYACLIQHLSVFLKSLAPLLGTSNTSHLGHAFSSNISYSELKYKMNTVKSKCNRKLTTYFCNTNIRHSSTGHVKWFKSPKACASQVLRCYI